MKDLKIKIAYNGKLDNMDNMRPEINMHCTLTENGKQLYKLENILVNGGRYDTYLVRNLSTKKLKRTTRIFRVLKSRPAFTKNEVWELILKQTTKPAAEFRALIERVENNADDIEAWSQLVKNALCDNHTAKTEGLTSLDTSCLITCADNVMRDMADMICNKCFSETQQGIQKTNRDKLIRNAYLFCFYDIPAAAFPIINRLWFRFECFGDLMNALQARNYVKLVLKNPRCTFTQWTKKPWILNHLFKTEEKPNNMIVILSAPRVNDTLTIAQARAAWPFVDKIFTVYSKEYLLQHDVIINCGGNHCLTCLNCYGLENTPEEIKEVLK